MRQRPLANRKRPAGLIAAVGALIVLTLVSTGVALAQVPAPAQPPAPAPAAAPPRPPAPAQPTPAPSKLAANQPPVPLPSASTDLSAAQPALTQLQNQAQTTSNDGQLAAMGEQAGALQSKAQAVAAACSAQMAQIDANLKPRPHHRETQAERLQQAPLLAQRTVLETQLRQAQAVAQSANATFNLIAERRRVGFSARVLERSAAPVSPGFWAPLKAAVRPDIDRLLAAAESAEDVALQAPEPQAALSLGAALLIALALLFPVRLRLEALGYKGPRPGERRELARAARALWIAALDTLLPCLAATIAHLCAGWAGVLSDKADALAGAGVMAVTWGAAILALGRVLAADGRGGLLNLPPNATKRIQISLWCVALVTGAGFVLTRLNYVIGASVAAAIATNCVLSLAYAAVAALILASFHLAPPSAEDQAAADPARTPIWTLLSLSLTAAIVVTIGAVLCGYTTLATLISGQIFWLSLLAAAGYLLLRVIDDVSNALFQDQGWAARTMFAMFGLRRSTINQAGVLLCAVLQLLVLVTGLSLALTPFGQSGDLLLSHISRLGQAVHIGSATISPVAVVAGLVSLVIGLALVHLIRDWVVRRYLPVTDWDAGVRNSVATGVGYIGFAIAALWALAAMGLGFQQIALIASALSVGIGFGLQQVVQNFAAGLILLIERPVKVGDWVSVDGVEGDIRRIRVRATEIQTSDRSTVIIPNSDLITKQVQNKTLGDPHGRIQLQLTIAKPADARRAAELIKATAQARDDILKTPAPAVYIDAVAGGGAVSLNAYVYVDSPRHAYQIRSDLYLQLLDALEKDGIAL